MKYFFVLLFSLFTVQPGYSQDTISLPDFEKNSLQTKHPHFLIRSSLPLEFYFTDFNDFSSLIGSYNTDLMDLFVVAGPEIGCSFSGVYTGLSLEFGYDYSDDHDSLIVSLFVTAFGLNLGYDIIDSPALRLTPMLSLRWLRFRLLNYDNDRKIPLSQYLEERNLDMRFNQLTLTTGMNLDYKFYYDNANKDRYWSVGLYGGYLFKLSKSPWLYSYGNRLTTDRVIDIGHFAFGISVSFFVVPQ
jgi:hypothetical protein